MPLRNKEKLLKRSSGLLVQNRSKDNSMEREEALEESEQKGIYIFPCTLLIVSHSISIYHFHVIHVKTHVSKFHFLPRLGTVII